MVSITSSELVNENTLNQLKATGIKFTSSIKGTIKVIDMETYFKVADFLDNIKATH